MTDSLVRCHCRAVASITNMFVIMMRSEKHRTSIQSVRLQRSDYSNFEQSTSEVRYLSPRSMCRSTGVVEHRKCHHIRIMHVRPATNGCAAYRLSLRGGTAYQSPVSSDVNLTRTSTLAQARSPSAQGMKALRCCQRIRNPTLLGTQKTMPDL